MLKPNLNQRGFTIVELLIVIVVIAILASISIVAYTGIQDRANAAKAASAAASYVRVIEMYRADMGQFPDSRSISSSSAVCLGPLDSFPGDGTFQAGECASWRQSGADRGHLAYEAFNSLLLPYSGRIPEASLYTVSASRGRFSHHTDLNYRGIVYRKDWSADEAYIHYFLRGDQDCPQGVSRPFEGITECVIGLGGDSAGGNWGYHGGEG